MYCLGLFVRILMARLNALVLENSAMKHRFAWSTVTEFSSGQVMLTRWFTSVGLSQPWPNFRDITEIPNLPPEVEVCLREVLPAIIVRIDSAV